MNGDAFPVGADELQAWVDNQLTMERAAEVERWLEQNPAEAARLSSYKAHRARLREALAPKAAEAIPWRLTTEGIRASRRAQVISRLRSLAASVLLLVAGASAGWMARGSPAAPTAAGQLATEAMQAHVTFIQEVRHPVEVVAAQEAHLVTWLSNRLKHKLKVPDLTAFGFHLVGGRLLPNEETPAAQFMFEDETGARLTLYLHQESSSDTGFDMVDRDGVAGFRWFEGGFGYVILAPAARSRLLEISETVYHQVSEPSKREP